MNELQHDNNAGVSTEHAPNTNTQYDNGLPSGGVTPGIPTSDVDLLNSVDNYKSQTQAEKQSHEETQTSLQEHQYAVGTLQEQLSEARLQNEKVMDEFSKMQHAVKGLEAKNKSLNSMLRSKTDVVKQKDSELQNVTMQNEKMSGEIHTNPHFLSLKEENNELANKNNELTYENKELKNEIASFNEAEEQRNLNTAIDAKVESEYSMYVANQIPKHMHKWAKRELKSFIKMDHSDKRLKYYNRAGERINDSSNVTAISTEQFYKKYFFNDPEVIELRGVADNKHVGTMATYSRGAQPVAAYTQNNPIAYQGQPEQQPKEPGMYGQQQWPKEEYYAELERLHGDIDKSKVKFIPTIKEYKKLMTTDKWKYQKGEMDKSAFIRVLEMPPNMDPLKSQF